MMRLVAGAALVLHAIAGLSGHLAIGPAALFVFQIVLGMLLLAGLWTPVAGTLAAAFALRSLFSQAGDPWLYVLLATLGVALALLGPGIWSIDARLFGWKRMDIRARQSRPPASSER